jgi:hypothetical protein
VIWRIAADVPFAVFVHVALPVFSWRASTETGTLQTLAARVSAAPTATLLLFRTLLATSVTVMLTRPRVTIDAALATGADNRRAVRLLLSVLLALAALSELKIER